MSINKTINPNCNISIFSSITIRTLDVFFSFFGLILISPLLLIISILLILENKGGIFFIQDRVGKNCIPFKIFKFRSMIKTNSYQGNIDKTMTLDEKKTLRKQMEFTSSNDKRITKIGSFLRKTSIDELPQLFNVLLGDMSLVGPRPDTPSQEVDYSIHHWQKRHIVRPGITGLAQINGRSSLNFSQKCTYENKFIEQFSIKTYFSIILKTVFVVLKISNTN